MAQTDKPASKREPIPAHRLTPAEEQDLLRRVKGGDAQAAARLVASHFGFVRHIARRYMNYGHPLADLIQEVARPELPDETIQKLAGIFDVLKPHLIEAYERTQRETDQIADAPTIELLDDIVRRTRRHVSWSCEVLDRLCDTDAKRETRRLRGEQMRGLLEACGGVTGELGADN